MDVANASIQDYRNDAQINDSWSSPDSRLEKICRDENVIMFAAQQQSGSGGVGQQKLFQQDYAEAFSLAAVRLFA